MAKDDKDTKNPDRIPDEWIAFTEGIPDEIYEVGRWAFNEILEGKTPRLKGAAEALGRPNPDVREAAATLEEWGLLATKDDRVTGAYGLSAEPTEYRVEIEGRPLYAWCALDAVGIPAGLGKSAKIEGPVRDSDETVLLRVEDGKVGGDVAADLRIALPDPKMDANVRREVCPEIAFYRHAKAPDHPNVAKLTLHQAMALGRRMWPETLETHQASDAQS